MHRYDRKNSESGRKEYDIDIRDIRVMPWE